MALNVPIVSWFGEQIRLLQLTIPEIFKIRMGPCLTSLIVLTEEHTLCIPWNIHCVYLGTYIVYTYEHTLYIPTNTHCVYLRTHIVYTEEHILCIPRNKAFFKVGKICTSNQDVKNACEGILI